MWTHCIDAPVATNGSYLIDLSYNGALYNYSATEVDIDGIVEYRCFNGMKHITNLGFTHQEATCGHNNSWTKPAQWEQCVQSKLNPTNLIGNIILQPIFCDHPILANWCDIPPNPEVNGTAFANSTGNKFGVVCPGTDVEEPQPSSSCPWVAITYTEVSPGNVRYQLNVTSDTSRADKVYLKIKFDTPIDTIIVRTQHSLPT